MHPFRCVSADSKWEVKHETTQNDSRKCFVNAGKLIQRIDDAFIAVTTAPLELDERVYSRSAEPGELNILDIWPKVFKKEDVLSLDIDPHPPSLRDKYEEAVFGSHPIFFFVKQALNKARVCMDLTQYMHALEELSVEPHILDDRYNAHSGDSRFLECAALKVAQENIPFNTAINQMRSRDTQIQIVLAMELHCSGAVSIEQRLQLYFDRLCIWQAVGTHPHVATEFCSSVLLPYYRARSPRKTKQLLRISKGTVRTGHIKPKRRATPRVIKAPGLLRALELQKGSANSSGSNASSPVDSQIFTPMASPEDSIAAAARTGSLFQANRSISHPVYRQQSLSATVEINFKTPRHRSPGTQPRLPASQPAQIPDVPKSPPRRPQFNPLSIQATPEKVRQQFMALPTDDDEEIGSTDSD